MTYLCIKCGAIWVVDEPTSEFSGGICECCIISYVRAKQIKQGHDDCFKRAVEICNKECKYHYLCCKHLNGDVNESQQDYFEHNSCKL